MANESLAGGSSGSSHVPSGLLVSMSNSLPRVVMEYDSDDDFCWAGHCEDKPWHIPPNRPLLKELHLKLEIIPSDPTAQPAAQQSTAMPTSSPPSYGGPTLAANESLAGGSSGSGHALSGLLASTSNSLP